MLERSIKMAEQLGDDEALGQCLYFKCAHLSGQCRFQEAIEVGRRSAELLRRSGSLWQLATSLAWVQQDLFITFRIEEAQEVDKELAPLAEKVGNFGAQLVGHRAKNTVAATSAGDLSAWDRLAAVDLELCQKTGTGYIGQSYSLMGVATFLRGSWDEALELYQRGAQESPPGALGGNWVFVPFCLAYMRKFEEAKALFDDHRGEFPRPGQANSWAAWLVLNCAVEAYAVMGEKERLVELHPLIVEALGGGQLVRIYDVRLLRTLAGIAASAARQWDESEQHFQESIRFADEQPLRIERPDVRRFYAQMLLDRGRPGDRDRAAQLLAEALTQYQEIGMVRHADLAQSLALQL
jgi:tetratricopeptide (TPR) repeat protein